MTEFPNQAGSLRYSVVIATCDREEMLERVLEDWRAQTVRPDKVVVVRAKKKVVSRQVTVVSPKEQKSRLRSSISDLPLVELCADEPSAAKQRNLGAREVESDWIVFCDDDVRFGPDLAERTLAFLSGHPEAAAVFPRMRGSGHPVPGNWLRKYHRFQAGFDDETYGAKLFGAGLSCYPCWEKQTAPVESNWLPSTMLWMKTDLFKRQEFPDFEGYSFGEDAHLTHRVWREVQPSGGKLYFFGEPDFEHLSVQSGIKTSRFRLGQMTVRNQQRIAKEAMGKSASEVLWKSLVHRGFMTVALLKGRRKGWVGEIVGVWSA